ncbi:MULTISPECIES: SLC13 family permease [Shewanella]|jgi:di/tricarboxylate transporter|uniref:SLC13 family permease n=1 Tax=Shewanella TaxID=22 RepID=UPI001674D2A5|nr:SLC13 family permease [Shewanella fodinae]MCL2905849.1 anion permease [Shewanella fodinae]
MANKFSLKTFLVALTIAFAIFISIYPISGYSVTFLRSAAIVIVTLVLWSSGFLPPFLTGLLFFAFATVFNVIRPDLLFSGFGSTAVWLIISGFVIGSAISVSGLGERIASYIAPHITASYPQLITGLVVTAVLLGFVMPSSVGRAVVLLPIGMALADKIGFAKGSNGRLGIATSLAIACNMPSFAILPANIPNMILAGASENLFHIHFGYTEYLLLHFPVLGILKSILLIWIVIKVFPAQVTQCAPFDQYPDEENELNSRRQKQVGLLLGITLLFWMTDSIHGINPAWVGLVVAILLLMPRWGVVDPKAFNSAIDFSTVVFVAAALGLGALVNDSGIGTSMGKLFHYILPDSSNTPFLSFMALSMISTLVGLIATIPGVPTVLTPMAADLAQSTGFSVPAVLMTQVVGFSTVIFPYQVGPLIVAMQLSREPLPKLLRITIPLAIATITILMPLDYLWWLIMGWID